MEVKRTENERVANESAPRKEKQIDTEKAIGEVFYEDFKKLKNENPKGYTIAIKISDGIIKLDNVEGRYFVAFKNYTFYDFENKTLKDIVMQGYIFVKLHSLFNISFSKSVKSFAVRVWLNSADNGWYADLGVPTNNLRLALAIAKKYEQKMVYDLKEQKEVFV